MGENSVSKEKTVVEKQDGFFKKCKEELGKVIKPTREETVQATIVTLVILSFVALVLCLYDILLGGIMSQFVELFKRFMAGL